MIVVDMEASGLEPHTHSLLSIGAVDFDHPEAQFYEECRAFDGAHIDPEALTINGFSEAQIHDSKKQSEADLIQHFLTWLEARDDHTIAGQNIHVDLSFLEAAAHRYHMNFSIAYRVIDLHSIAYAHLISRGISIPMTNKHSALNSDTIMKYVGIPSEPKPHVGINGAIWETEAFHRLLYGASLLSQFKEYPIPFTL